MTYEKELKFEEGMEKLESILGSLERGELDLNEAIEKFKEGSEIHKKLTEKLNAAEGEIKKVLQQADGSLKFEDM